MPFNQATGKRCETAREERIDILLKQTEGKTFEKIAEEIGVSKSTCARVWRKWKASRKIEHAAKTGRRPKLSKRDIRYLKRLSDKNPSATLAEITAESGLEISTWTAGQVLRKEGWWVHVAHKKPYLDRRKKTIRYTWCKLRQR